ncbi:MAG: (d)CMP kinase [Firmicutes bacterium]|nr:(d)CMP kinase [Bacillota bacterium]
MGKGISIALDGPAGSGKSTIARAVALKFNYIYIDTGAMYRAVTLKALQNKIPMDNGEALTQLANQTLIRLKYIESEGFSQLRVIMDGADVSDAIRSLEVTNSVSLVSAVAGVRVALVKLQRDMAQEGGVVMDGRDIGTVVLPDAELKIFLTASVKERSKRRWLELKAKGIEVDPDELEEQIRKRDEFDSNREVNPLRQADDAILLDTTALSIEEVTDRIIELAVARGGEL